MKRIFHIFAISVLTCSMLFTACTEQTPADTNSSAESGAEISEQSEVSEQSETSEPEKESKVILRFTAASDVHMSSLGSVEANRLSQLFKSTYAYAETQPYTKLDASFFAGDITNNGNEYEYASYNKVIKNSAKEETKVITVLGNHEYYGGGKPMYKKQMSENTNYHEVINGYHFIALSLDADDTYSGETMNFLKEELKKAAEDKPDQAIFVFQHRHIQNTVYVSTEWYSGQSAALNSILKQYPQVIDFSGHSHGPINHPESFCQKDYTTVGTGTLSYFEMTSGMTYGTIPPSADQAAQFWIVEVYDDGKVDLKPYNLLTDNFFRDFTDPEKPMEYIVEPAKGKDGFRYANRKATAVKPAFAADAQIAISNVTAEEATITIPQAKSTECIYSYNISCKCAAGTKEYNYFSEYYFEPAPEKLTFNLTQLEPESDYTVSVYPVNCYGQKGEPITAEMKTLKGALGDYSTTLPVTYDGTFAIFDSMSELTMSKSTLAYGGKPDGDVFCGDWASGSTGTGSKAELASGKGWNGSTALAVSSTASVNQGLYIFANESNRFPTAFRSGKYMRVWVDFTDVDFRKANFGLLKKNGSLYTTDENDNRTDLHFWYLAEGSDTWVEMNHGSDGCFGTAQNGSVKGLKGWLAFPTADFGYRAGTGTGATSGFNGNEIAGVYMFWDYDKSADYIGKAFYLDEIQLVPDYKTFDKYEK